MYIDGSTDVTVFISAGKERNSRELTVGSEKMNSELTTYPQSSSLYEKEQERKHGTFFCHLVLK